MFAPLCLSLVCARKKGTLRKMKLKARSTICMTTVAEWTAGDPRRSLAVTSQLETEMSIVRVVFGESRLHEITDDAFSLSAQSAKK